MSAGNGSKSRAIHSRLGHPVVDTDGHWIETRATAIDYIREIAGPKVLEKFQKNSGQFGWNSWLKLTPQERKDRRVTQPSGWWAFPTKNTLDRATSMLPKLMYERLDDIGLDFAVLYPSGIETIAFMSDEELRRAGTRALNQYFADTWRDYSDRITPAAAIPMHTPEEAIEELEHAKALGFKAVLLTSLIRRPIPAAVREGVSRRYAVWLDVLGMDSEYDYDPVWQKLIDLKLAPSFHSASENFGLRNSMSNFVYNHIGHFGEAGNAVCKALFLGGVTRRFPKLKVAFLEAGAMWACSVYSDLFGHWKKRSLKGLENTDPANLNRELFADLVRRYGGEKMYARLPEIMETQMAAGLTGSRPENLDDFAACKIEKAEDIRDLFVPHFFFGCESDDPLNGHAFDKKANPFGARLNAMLSSDISHFDVTDMSEVLEEAHELVDHKIMSEEDFRDFSFANAVRFFGGMNPDFFKGTAVEKKAAEVLATAK